MAVSAVSYDPLLDKRYREKPEPEEQVEALGIAKRWATYPSPEPEGIVGRAYLALLTQQPQERAELDRAVERLELIARNAESWHHDEEALRRAMNVIAAWARGGEIPEVLLTDLRAASPGKGAEGEAGDA